MLIIIAAQSLEIFIGCWLEGFFSVRYWQEGIWSLCTEFRALVLCLPCLLGNRDDILPLEMKNKAVAHSGHHAIITDSGS